MSSISQLVSALDPEKTTFQILTNGECSLTLKGGRQGKNATHLEVKFSSSPANMGKEALIIWVDHKDLSSAISKLSD